MSTGMGVGGGVKGGGSVRDGGQRGMGNIYIQFLSTFRNIAVAM